MGTQSLSPLGPLAIPLPSRSLWSPWGPQGLPVVYGQGPVWDPGAPFRRMANANLSLGPSTPFRALDYVLQCLRFFFLASLTVTRIGGGPWPLRSGGICLCMTKVRSMLNGGGGVRGLWSMQGASVCGRRAAYVKGGRVGVGKTRVCSR